MIPCKINARIWEYIANESIEPQELRALHRHFPETWCYWNSSHSGMLLTWIWDTVLTANPSQLLVRDNGTTKIPFALGQTMNSSVVYRIIIRIDHASGQLTWTFRTLKHGHHSNSFYIIRYYILIFTCPGSILTKKKLLQATRWFIAHGGFNGVTEPLGSGVPL